jgi:hypothetical protein
MSKFIKCPICDRQIMIVFDGKKISDFTISEKIKKHITNHTLGDIQEFLTMDMAGQVNKIFNELGEKK